MPISLVDLEQALRNALPISHLEIIDQSSGCGESYAVLIVSEVSSECFFPAPRRTKHNLWALTVFRGQNDAGKASDGWVN
jgi:hypothetical protein